MDFEKIARRLIREPKPIFDMWMRTLDHMCTHEPYCNEPTNIFIENDKELTDKVGIEKKSDI